MASSDISPRALKIARSAAQATAAKAQNLITFKRATDWPTFEKLLGLSVPAIYRNQPFGWPAVRDFSRYWVDSTEERLKLASEPIKSVVTTKVDVNKSTDNIGSVTLLPEQQIVVDQLWNDLFINKIRHVAYQDGMTGSGKTFVVGALIARAIAANIHKHPSLPMDLPFRYLVVTRKNVVEQFKRVLESFGLGKHIGGIIYVTSYSALTSSSGELFYKETYNALEDKYEYSINEVFAPNVLFLDEAHALNNPNTKQTALVSAYLNLKTPPIQVWLSATPWVTVNNSRTFVLSTRHNFCGMTITPDTWPAFAGSICREPHKPNMAAAKRLREILSPYIYSFPYVKWPHKAINQILIVDFEKPEHRLLYEQAFEVYQERKKRAGLNTSYGRFEEFVALGQFRKAVEPFRMPALVERTIEHINDNKAVIIGTAFRESIAQASYRLSRAGIPRDKQSIIWGGRRDWKKDLLLSDDELNELLNRGKSGEVLDPYEISQLQETLLYRTERTMYGETEEAHAQRLAEMRELGLLGMQSASQRQTEIDKFQSGESLVCLFTLAAGGVGLSLDHAKQELRPRIGYFTPAYSGPEFKQALGRAVRRTTLSDTYQYMCYMQGTVEEYHVAPLIDRKLKCIAEITKSNFNIVDLDTTERIEHKYRTAEEAIKDAESDESQFTGGDSEEQDED